MKTIRLGNAGVCPEQNCLIIDGDSVHLEPKMMAVLVMLMDEAGEVVTRQALMDSVWAGRVVGEEVLTRCISELRSALGDKASDPRFIQTVPKRGYRLLVTPTATPIPRPYRRRVIAIAATAVLAVVAAIAGYLDSRPVEPVRIAVLPFLTDSADDHFGTGVAEELMNTLVGIPGLRVSSRTAAFGQQPDADPRSVGEKLDVDALLTGTLRRGADGFRMSVRLVDVASGDHLWADTLEGPESTLYAMQDQVIAAVTGKLGITVEQPLLVARSTASIDALDLYLLGRHHWHERTPEGLERAVTYFQQAIDADPGMSEAHSGLADAYLLQTSYDHRDSASAVSLAEPLIERALALDPESADAHASHGILLQKHADYQAAEEALQRSVALDPNHSMAHMWLGNAVMAQGRLRDAFEHYGAAFALDPQHPAVTHNYVNTMIELGEYEQARSILASRMLADRAITRMSAQLALEAGDWLETERLAGLMDEDLVGADLLRWRLELKRQNVSRAEAHLAAAARRAPEDERVYLAALEHQTLTPGAMRFHGVLDYWESRPPTAHKLDLMARAWGAIAQVGRGEMDTATGELAALLGELKDSYPPFRMKLMSHLLIALEGSGQLAAYQRWRADALLAAADFVQSGWGSFEFQLERGYLLAAAGEPDAAIESFRAAGRMGDLSFIRLAGDLRNSDPDTSALLNDVI